MQTTSPTLARPLSAESTMPVATRWERTSKDQIFTADEVFAAWMKGRNEALRDDLKAKVRVFEDNMVVLFEFLQDVYRFLDERNLSALGAYLKPESWSVFRMLIIVTEDTYVSDEFFHIFPFIQQKETEIAAKNVCHVSVTFLDGESFNDINLNHLVSDGYHLYHDNTDGSSGTGRA